MPSPVISAPSNTNAHQVDNKASSSKPKRLIRRRGRGRGEDSDEEFEREALTDSGESLSAHDSDADSADEDEPPKPVNGATPPSAKAHPVRSSAASPLPKPANGVKPVIPASTNWSDMVTAEESESSNLPVVDFEDLGKLAATSVATNDSPSTSASALTPGQIKAAKLKAKRKAKKELLKSVHKGAPASSQPSSAQPTAPVVDDSLPTPDEPAASTSTPGTTSAPTPAASSQPPSRPPRPNARQAYLERLTNDPSYVPRVGAFWGHDDRLMDKELRSMSPWWRGRGRGGAAGRGRGAAFAPTRDSGWQGRGRGGFTGSQARTNGASDASPPSQSEAPSRAASTTRPAQDDTDNVWGKASPSSRGMWGDARGRGGVRGRGVGRGGRPAGPAPRSSAEAAESSSQSPATGAKVKPASRIGKKTERAWTKPLDGSLLANANGHHRSATPSSPATSDVRVKLPGVSPPTSVQVISDDLSLKRVKSTHTDRGADQRSESGSTAEHSRPAVVKLPSKHKVKVSVSAAAAASAAAKSTQHARSPLAVAEPTPPTAESSVKPTASEAPAFSGTANGAEEKDPFVVRIPPDQTRADIVRQTLNADTTAPTTSQSPPPPSSSITPPRSESTAPLAVPAYAPLRPSYPSLPPGVAVSESGHLYEVATGRPVILAPPPQPAPQLFHPPPRMAANPYAPSFTPRHHPHEFHHTPPAGTPPPLLPSGPYSANGYDSPRYSPYPLESPMDASAPIFMPARSSAVEIRAPSADTEGSSNGKSSSSTNGTTASSTSSPTSVNVTKPTHTHTHSKSYVKPPSSLRTVSAVGDSQAPPSDMVSAAVLKDHGVDASGQTPQQYYPPQQYANGGAYPYYPGPEYAVYAPVPIGMDGQPQYSGYYPDAQYLMSPYEASPYSPYGATYYNPVGAYGAPPPPSAEGEMPQYY